MEYGQINDPVLQTLKEAVGEKNFFTAEAISEDYTHDEFSLREIARMPAVLVKPETKESVSAVLRIAQENRIPVTPRGGGTGLCGGCIPLFGGILLSLEKLAAVEETDTDNMMITCQGGVRLSDLYAESEKAGLFFPPHPGDENAMVGGVISTNAGGSRAVKYGVVRNFVRGMEVVLPGGDILKIGGKMSKTSSGYNLLHLFTGSEGTLGIITRATIALMAPPGAVETLIAPFSSARDAVKAVLQIMNRGVIPMALELLEGKSIRLLEDKLDMRWPGSEGEFFLMAILDGPDQASIDQSMGKTAEICAEYGSMNILVADSAVKQREVLHMRSMLYEGIKPYTVETLDISLPRSELADHVERVTALSHECDIWVPTYGHAADGNLHSHITKVRFEGNHPEQLDETEWKPSYERVRDEIHRDAIDRGGTVSGEHGIGLVKKKYLKSFIGERQIEIMRGIKRTFDPYSILNPGKIFDA